MSLHVFLIQALIYFITRQIKKYADEIDWGLVKADALIRIEKLIPGDEFDGPAKTLVTVFIDFVEEYFTGKNLEVALEQARSKLGY